MPADETRSGDLLSIRGLTVRLQIDDKLAVVVDDVSLDIERGATLGLVGESGSGKSVTGLSVMRLLPCPPGEIVADRLQVVGVDVLDLDRRGLEHLRGDAVAMVFQDPMSCLNPAFTVGQQIAAVVRRHRGVSRRAAKDRAVEMLDLVGIPNARRRVDDFPHQFSGGMRQRVAIAMALSCDPSLLIADEPTTALDVTIQAQVLELLDDMKREFGMTVLFISHDLEVIATECHRVSVMYAGQIVEEGSPREIFQRPLHPYTEGLIKSMPRLEARSGKLTPIPGMPPTPGRWPTGCRFAPRCPYVEAGCLESSVPLQETAPGRTVRCLRADELELSGSP